MKGQYLQSLHSETEAERSQLWNQPPLATQRARGSPGCISGPVSETNHLSFPV